MRDYARVSPRFWIGKTGRKLRGDPATQLVAMYLITSPHANMLGLYYLPLIYVAKDMGLPLEDVERAMQRLIEEGYCSYCAETDTVWVHEAAVWQIGEELKPGDNQIKGVQNYYNALHDNPFLAPFFDRYSAAYQLKERRESLTEQPKTKPLASPSEGPPKPLASPSEARAGKEQAQAQAAATRAREHDAPVDNSPPAQTGTHAALPAAHSEISTPEQLQRWASDVGIQNTTIASGSKKYESQALPCSVTELEEARALVKPSDSLALVLIKLVEKVRQKAGGKGQNRSTADPGDSPRGAQIREGLIALGFPEEARTSGKVKDLARTSVSVDELLRSARDIHAQGVKHSDVIRRVLIQHG